jgi:AraC-like DNA-binding protein
LVDGAKTVHVVHNVAELGRTAFHFIDYGADVDVTVDPLDFVLVQIPLSGRALIRAGGQELVATPGIAAVTTPTDPLSMRYLAPNPRLMVKIDRLALESRLTRMLGVRPRAPIRFDLGMDLSSNAGRSWRSIVDLVFDDLDRGGTVWASPLASESVETAIIDGLLAAQRHSYTERLLEPGVTARPRTLRKALTLIDEHCAEPLTTADIAEAVGVSVRSLQEGFQRHLGTTPMAYLRTVRLHRVNHELKAPGPTTSVTDVALRWGVTHTGRLANEYRQLFGESPSATLRQAR